MKKSLLFGLLLLSACSSQDDEVKIPKTVRIEPIVRKSEKQQFTPSLGKAKGRPAYPWKHSTSYRPITKEHFRCKGSYTNPVRTVVEKKGNTGRYFDCGGVDRHSLFLRDGNEFIYPILLDLLNYVQEKSGREVVVTSGYRCPDHNTYVDPTPANASSKHMIGAAVDFYVPGVDAEKVVCLLMEYYKEHKSDFGSFERAKKSDTSTLPWMNKEIFIKLYKPSEGRDLDNTHAFSYICLQVRYDTEKNQKVICNWDEAFRGYHRK